MWAGIKHAINSTLGTSRFKSLDTILYETVTMKASDELFFVSQLDTIYVDEDNDGQIYYFPRKYQTTKYGEMRVIHSVELANMKNYTFTIYKNGEVLESFTGSGNTKGYTVTLNFVPYDTFEFSFSSKYNSAYTEGQIRSPTLQICGTIVPNVINSSPR